MVADELFSVIAERTRRDILSALAHEQKAVGQLVDELGVSQPTVSKHLKVLREAGVVRIRAQGQRRFYSINTEPLSQVARWLDSIGATAHSVPEAQAVKAAQLPLAPDAATARLNGVDGQTSSRPVAVALVPETRTPDGEGAAEGTVQQQISRSVGRAANKAADLLANLPTFRRRKD